MPFFYLVFARLLFGRRAAQQALHTYLAIWAVVIGAFLLLLLAHPLIQMIPDVDYPCEWQADQHTAVQNAQMAADVRSGIVVRCDH